MKKLSLILILLLQLTITKGQQYYPFPDSGAVWNNAQFCYSLSDTIYSQYGIIGDTSFNSIPYHKLYLLHDTSLNVSTSIYYGAIREQTRKIYFRYLHCQNEILLYDFTKQIGDSIHSLFSEWDIEVCQDTTTYNGIVTGIDSTLIDGSYHKVYHIGPYYPDWIEGIGSLAGLLNPIPPQITGFDKWELVCYKKDGIVQYHNPHYYACFPLPAGINKNINNSNYLIKVYPQPFNNTINIEFENQDKENFTLTLYSAYGQDVRKINYIKTNKVILDCQDLKSGMYFIVLTNNENERQIIKIIKE